jgi:hypothetical protein
MRLPASTQSARPVPPVRDESARAPKHPDTSQRKGLASSHFRRGFPRSPYSGIGSARWPPRRSSLDPPPARGAVAARFPAAGHPLDVIGRVNRPRLPAGLLRLPRGRLPHHAGRPAHPFRKRPGRARRGPPASAPAAVIAAPPAPDGRPMMLSACFTACPSRLGQLR